MTFKVEKVPILTQNGRQIAKNDSIKNPKKTIRRIVS